MGKSTGKNTSGTSATEKGVGTNALHWQPHTKSLETKHNTLATRHPSPDTSMLSCDFLQKKKKFSCFFLFHRI